MTTETAPLPRLSVTVGRDENNTWCCSPKKLKVTTPNTLLYFNLEDDDYEFDMVNALVLLEESTSFPDPPIRVSSTQMRLLDLNLQTEDIPYDVNLRHRTTGATQRVEIDPQIGNQPN
jgi:hypothetical protein